MLFPTTFSASPLLFFTVGFHMLHALHTSFSQKPLSTITEIACTPFKPFFLFFFSLKLPSLFFPPFFLPPQFLSGYSPSPSLSYLQCTPLFRCTLSPVPLSHSHDTSPQSFMLHVATTSRYWKVYFWPKACTHTQLRRSGVTHGHPTLRPVLHFCVNGFKP